MFNAGRHKTEVMVFHGKGMSELRKRKEVKGGWMLGLKKLEVVDEYVYLGVTVDSKGKFDGWKRERLMKAEKAWWGAWRMGVDGMWVTVRNAVMIWKVMVQAVLDYAVEVFGGMDRWEEAERLARKMGRAVLGVRKSTTNEVVMGELGWWTMKGRRDFLRLMYWREIVSRREGLRWMIYEEGRERERVGEESWCQYTRKVMIELGLGEYWDVEEWKVGKDEWRRKVVERIQEREEKEWMKRMEGKRKLRTYRKVKKRLEMEEYLRQGTVQQRRVMVMMRGGTNDLRIETGRYEKLEEKERICCFCESGEVEDEEHFLCHCEAWRNVRERIVCEVRRKGRFVVGVSDLEIMMVCGKAGDGKTREEWNDVINVVMRGVAEMAREREVKWKEMRSEKRR